MLDPYSNRCDVVLRKTNKRTHTCTMPPETGDSHAVGEHQLGATTLAGVGARKITPDWNQTIVRALTEIRLIEQVTRHTSHTQSDTMVGWACGCCERDRAPTMGPTSHLSAASVACCTAILCSLFSRRCVWLREGVE